MNINADYNKILIASKKEELQWLEREFELLFKDKKENCSEVDKKLANQILDNLIVNINTLEDEYLINILAKTLEGIEGKFPELF